MEKALKNYKNGVQYDFESPGLEETIANFVPAHPGELSLLLACLRVLLLRRLTSGQGQ